MQQVVILASSLWVKPSKRERENLEKTYLKLANYILAEKVEGRDVRAIWFCSSPIVSETISEFSSDYNLALEFITLAPGESVLESAQLEQAELSTKETRERELIRLDNEFWDDIFPFEIDLYISQHFSDALEIMPPNAFNGLPVWFVANIANNSPSYLEESGLLESYIAQFPHVFQAKALTLLAICFDDVGDGETWGVINEYKIQLLCFAKFLHGFVCAADYNFNDFEANAAINALSIDSFYLGGILPRDIFDEIIDYSDYDEELWDTAYTSIANDNINALISALCNRIGESCLFAMLWWGVYPNLSQPVDNKIDDLFGDVHFGEEESYIRMRAFELVLDGWSDYADND